MKCNHCSAEWNIPEAVATTLQNCPFCGKSLATTIPINLDTPQAVLLEIKARFGIEALRDGRKCIAYFSDLAPKLIREKQMLTYLFHCQGNIKLLDALNKDSSEQQACHHQLATKMENEYLVSHDIAIEACAFFWEAIGGADLKANEEPQKEIPSQKESPHQKSESPTSEKESVTQQPPQVSNTQTPKISRLPEPLPIALEPKKTDPKKLYELGYKFEKGYGIPKDPYRAYKAYLDAANLGYAEAQHKLGTMYFDGNGVLQSFTEALSWFEKAAKQNHAPSMEQISLCYKNGYGVTPDKQEADYWHRMSIKHSGNTTRTASPMPKPTRSTPTVPTNSTHNITPEAQYNLGRHYEQGSGGFQKDFCKAFDCYTKAANANFPKALLALGECYLYGRGAQIDVEKALAYFESASVQSSDPGTASLAKYYMQKINREYPQQKARTDWRSAISSIINRFSK